MNPRKPIHATKPLTSNKNLLKIIIVLSLITNKEAIKMTSSLLKTVQVMALMIGAWCMSNVDNLQASTHHNPDDSGDRGQQLRSVGSLHPSGAGGTSGLPTGWIKSGDGSLTDLSKLSSEGIVNLYPAPPHVVIPPGGTVIFDGRLRRDNS